MSKDKITGETIYNLEVRFINKDKSKCFKYPHRIKFYEKDGCSADIIMPDIWFEHKDLDKYVADLEAKLAEILGVSLITINRWENEQSKPSKVAIIKFEEFCQEKGIIFKEK